ncbi:winged helix-turn-helix domain-containing protein [Streptosporangium sp. NBC_01810]|uniref:winged helix-turn-helix domain-containing protein n=1 Tax=Streptosporangium sp. NBC_01810 TaxID=2975951 RepID=UPI002DD9A989|nr:winged helix-turn-helix domain-containing protein [Streptosporangium sp. NBC_01810]WSA25999.1 winged helix-turn-helix domain-containing protein [Streptosporangium sp. NBC_01810]
MAGGPPGPPENLNIYDRLSSPQTLAAGSKLALCEQHGASRNTVRQALDELKCEGLIVIRHGKGHFVQSVRD